MIIRDGTASFMGHGAQRSIQIALVNALAEVRRTTGEAAARTVLLLVDEPELYLHPQAIAVARAALKGLSNNEYQIAFSTHSADFIGHDDVVNTLIIRRSIAQGTHSLNRLSLIAAEAIEDAAFQAELLFELSNSRELLFCDKVLIVEGRTEYYLIPHIYHHLFGRTLIQDRIGLIKVNGSQNLSGCKRILDSLGINSRVLCDLDFLLREGSAEGIFDINNPAFLQILERLKLLSRSGSITLHTDGFPKKGGGQSAESAFAILAADSAAQDCIKHLVDLGQSVGVFAWEMGSIEHQLSLPGKGPKHWEAFVRKAAEQGLENVAGIDCVRKALTLI